MLYRRYGRPRFPWRDVARLRREMDRLLATEPSWSGSAAAPCYPAMNVWTNEDGAVVTAELPGFDPETIDVSVVGNTLTVSGERQPEEVGEDGRYHRRERSCGRFKRSFELPFQVDATKVDANLENGVLNVALPRAEEDKPKRITVKAS
jgi:HSP20 family protein